MNATLTVRAKASWISSEKRAGEEFTDAVVRKIIEHKQDVVFMLWGNYAKNKGSIIDRDKHHVLEAPHPSPFSAHSGFFGSKHFSKANDYLQSVGQDEVDWS